MNNQKGSALVLVLLVIVMVSIIGVTISNMVVNETKQTVKSEKNMQSMYLAESGLVHFEDALYRYVEESDTVDINDFINDYEWKLHDKLDPEKEEVEVTATYNEDEHLIRVTSMGKVDNEVTELISEYELQVTVDLDDYTHQFANFESALPLDFADNDLIGLALLPVDLRVVKYLRSNEDFNIIPYDRLIQLGLIGKIIELSINDSQPFSALEERSAVATIEEAVLSLSVGDILTVNLLHHNFLTKTNVLISGITSSLNVLELIKVNKFFDIDFVKLGVIGNVLIKQDKDEKIGLIIINEYDTASRRYFSFREGLFATESIYIGGQQDKGDSSLGLIGTLVALEDVEITHAKIWVGEKSGSKYIPATHGRHLTIQAHGDVLIDKACIQLKNNNYDFRIFTKGTITINNTGGCNEYPGFYYAENGIKVYTNGKQVTFPGGVVGEIQKMDAGPDIIYDQNHPELPEEIVSYKLVPLGRSIGN